MSESKSEKGLEVVRLKELADEALAVTAALPLPPGWSWHTRFGFESASLVVRASNGTTSTIWRNVPGADLAQRDAWAESVNGHGGADALDAIVEGAKLLAKRRGLPPGEAAIRELADLARGLPDGWSLALDLTSDEASLDLWDPSGEPVEFEDGVTGAIAEAQRLDAEGSVSLGVATVVDEPAMTQAIAEALAIGEPLTRSETLPSVGEVMALSDEAIRAIAGEPKTE